MSATHSSRTHEIVRRRRKTKRQSPLARNDDQLSTKEMRELFGTPPRPTPAQSEAGSSERLCVHIDDTPSLVSDTSNNNKDRSPMTPLSPVTPLEKAKPTAVAPGTISLLDHYEQLRFVRNVADERQRLLQTTEQRHAREMQLLQEKVDEADALRAKADETASGWKMQENAFRGRIASLESHATQQKAEILVLRERCVSATADRDAAAAEMENRLRAADGRYQALLGRFREREGKVNQYKASTEHWHTEARARQSELDEMRSAPSAVRTEGKEELAARLAEKEAAVQKLSKAALDARVDAEKWRGRANRAETKLLQEQATHAALARHTGEHARPGVGEDA